VSKNDIEPEPVTEPASYVTTWTRGADGSFNDMKKERMATLLAGGKTIRDAAAQCGVHYQTGIVWAKTAEMKARKALLRQTPAVSQTFSVSIAMICADLYKNSMAARDEGEFQASNAALTTLYKIAKAEKSLLESFDAKVATQTQQKGGIVAALQAHLGNSVDTDGESL
jgi:hypothetical protein